MRHKVGIYVRVSTEEQAQVVDGSIDTQQHRLKSFIDVKNVQETAWGKIVDSYVDDGFSAKDTRRPAFQRMMRDIKSGKINLILVTDLSRLSRNIMDFCILLEDLKKANAKFLSLKEQFDTSTPAGEMMVFNMINLAQFERKQTSERVSMNFHSRAMRGLLNGSHPILGFDKDPENPGKYIVNETEASQVREVFKLYQEMPSLRATVESLNKSSIRPKAAKQDRFRHNQMGLWTADSLQSVLRNPAYVGLREINKMHKSTDQETLKPWQRHQVVKAAWPAIVPELDFSIVKKSLEEAWAKDRERRKKQERRIFLLSGILRCKECGRALIGQTAHGESKTHRYYAHKPAIPGETNRCKVNRFRADEIEDAVVKHLDEILFRAGHLDQVEEDVRKSLSVGLSDLGVRRDFVNRQIAELEGELNSIIKLQMSLDMASAGAELVKEKLDQVATRKRELVQEREFLRTEIEKSEDAKEIRGVIEDNATYFKQGWKKATPVLRKRLLRRVIETIHFTPDCLKILYITDKASLLSNQPLKTQKASEQNSGASIYNINNHRNRRNQPAGYETVSRLSSLVNGGSGENRTPTPLRVLDFESSASTSSTTEPSVETRKPLFYRWKPV